MPGIRDVMHGALSSGRELLEEVVGQGRDDAGQITIDQALEMYERIRREPGAVEAYGRWQFSQVHPEVDDDVEIRRQVRRYQTTMERERKRRVPTGSHIGGR